MIPQVPSNVNSPSEKRSGNESLQTDLSYCIEGNLDSNSEIGIILPTYCEAQNIKKLIDEIENLNLDLSILVIDDSSPDATSETVRKCQEEYDNILLFARPRKLGLGTAITDGFRIFLSVKNPPKYVITMDADYSHNPKEIPRLIAPVQKGCDLVVGSRYCQNGSAKDWNIIRLVLSKIANLFTKLRISAKISDYTSGMRCYSTKLVRCIIPHLHSRTYEIQIETIRQANMRNFRIRETPITFVNRKKGKSKLRFNEIKDFLFYILFFN